MMFQQFSFQFMEFIYFLTYFGRYALTLAPRTDRSYNLRSIQLLLTNSEMQQNVQHIDIPFDELKIFIAGKEEIYQDIIIETLLLSTLVNVHWGKRCHKASIFITAKSCWLYKSADKKYSIPLTDIKAIFKSIGHPEMVLHTEDGYDNVRISASSDDRCWSIISAISYQFAYIQMKYLFMINVKDGNLSYFERSSQQKMNSKGVNLASYPKQKVIYEKPFRGITDIYGHIPPTSKVILEKQVPIQNSEGREDHTVYQAKMITSFSNSQHYICHFVEKKQCHLQDLYQHRNQQYIQQLIYVKANQYKIQVYFQYAKQIRGITITLDLFKKMWALYDTVKKEHPEKGIITTDNFVVVQKDEMFIEKSESSQKEGKVSKGSLIFDEKRHKLVVKQFRYDFLLQYEPELERFKFQDIPSLTYQNSCTEQQQNQDQDEERTTKSSFMEDSDNRQQQPDNEIKIIEQSNKEKVYFQNKMYTMGMIMYELFTGKNPLDYQVLQTNLMLQQNENETIEMSVHRTMSFLLHMKHKIHEQDIEALFSTYLQSKLCDEVREFIQMLLFKQFKDESEIFAHKWIKIWQSDMQKQYKTKQSSDVSVRNQQENL